MPTLPTLLPEFQRFQLTLAAHIRDPKACPRPSGIEARRMKIYNELVYNNIEGFLLTCFPVLRKVLGTPRWAQLVRAFIATHRSHSPFFRQIPDEFIRFLQTKWVRTELYPEFVQELAHYEWIELVLSVSTSVPDWSKIDSDPASNLLAQRPVLNPVLANLHYHWPVQHIRPRARIASTETHMLVFRDAGDQVQFMEINAFTARLLDLLMPAEQTGQAALERVISESRHPAPEVVIQGGLSVLQDLRKRGALLGVLRR